MMAVFVCSLALLFVQNPPAPPDLAGGQKVYAERCAGCHEADFRGTDQGPGLTGNPLMRRMSVQRLRNIIKNGIPDTGMPPFDLPAEDLEALASLVRSLNSQAAESHVPGNPTAGEQFFFGKGECGSCHMVSGRGQPVGSDLSNLGDERTIDEIQSALKEPSADITPGYQSVTVKLRDGNIVRGFARNRSNLIFGWKTSVESCTCLRKGRSLRSWRKCSRQCLLCKQLPKNYKTSWPTSAGSQA
jgi:mono/diheme cytochrome c family protein